MIIDHDAIALNSIIDEMFSEVIKESIPGIMAKTGVGVGWSASTCQDGGASSFRIVGRFTTESGKVAKGSFVISLSEILDHDGVGKGWRDRCRETVLGQIRQAITGKE